MMKKGTIDAFLATEVNVGIEEVISFDSCFRAAEALEKQNIDNARKRAYLKVAENIWTYIGEEQDLVKRKYLLNVYDGWLDVCMRAGAL